MLVVVVFCIAHSGVPAGGGGGGGSQWRQGQKHNYK